MMYEKLPSLVHEGDVSKSLTVPYHSLSFDRSSAYPLIYVFPHSGIRDSVLGGMLRDKSHSNYILFSC